MDREESRSLWALCLPVLCKVPTEPHGLGVAHPGLRLVGCQGTRFRDEEGGYIWQSRETLKKVLFGSFALPEGQALFHEEGFNVGTESFIWLPLSHLFLARVITGWRGSSVWLLSFHLSVTGNMSSLLHLFLGGKTNVWCHVGRG